MEKVEKDYKIIIWITKNPDSDEVKSNVERLKEVFQEETLNLFASAQEAFEFIKTNKRNYFSLNYVICEDIMFEEWGRLYITKFLELKSLCATVILTSDLSKVEKFKFFKHSFVNPGGAVTSIEGAIEYIQRDECNWENISEEDFECPFEFKGERYNNFFKKIESLNELKKYQSLATNVNLDSISEEDLRKFRDYLFSYKNEKINIFAKPSHEKNISVPIGILAKYFIRLYESETNFYRDMNRNLTHEENVIFYQVYINILYYGLKNGAFPYIDSIPVFRGSKMSKAEFEEMEKSFKEKKELEMNSPGLVVPPLLYSIKNFFSFSQDENVAENFLKHMIRKDHEREAIQGLVYVEFILKPMQDKDNFIPTNIDVYGAGLTKYPREKESVFLPFSCFEIMEISTKELAVSRTERTEIYVITMQQAALKI